MTQVFPLLIFLIRKLKQSNHLVCLVLANGAIEVATSVTVGEFTLSRLIAYLCIGFCSEQGQKNNEGYRIGILPCRTSHVLVAQPRKNRNKHEQRERERERDRPDQTRPDQTRPDQTRQTDRQRDRQTDTETDTETDRQTDTDRQQTDNRRRQRQAGRQPGRQAGRTGQDRIGQDRQTDRQTNTHKTSHPPSPSSVSPPHW